MPALPIIRQVRFEVCPCGSGQDSGCELVPLIDGVGLVDLVSAYEHAAGYEVAGEYAGLVLGRFDFGDLTSYLAGQPDSQYWAEIGAVALLGCECGEVGCWPLYAQVIVAGNLVTWRGFTQPHRPWRDYGCFGPFVFQRDQYEHAVREAVLQVARRFRSESIDPSAGQYVRDQV